MDLLSEASRLGIDAAYVDARGRRRTVPPEVIAKIVEALRTGAAAPSIAPVEPQAGPSAAAQAYQGPAGRWWILAAQLYGVRSRRNWGHGDFSDLLALIDVAAQLGAAGVGVNPLHTLFDDRPAQRSPYSPNSRLFLNPLYIDVAAIADLAAGPPAGIAAEIARLRAAELVDHVGVAAVKQRCLRLAYREFSSHATPARREDFDAFRHARGPSLARFACFEALRRRLQGPWWEWPIEWRKPDDAALARLRAEAAEEIEFCEYVQWIADRQLMRCRARAHELGLPIGLYLDVAVGVQADGFDAWNAPEALVRTLSVGAPPDQLNAAGQNWGLAGFSGVGLQALAFQPFRDMLRASMRYAGAIRLDHVLGLKRLYLIPAGSPPDQGAYVRLPFEQLLRITADESARNRCIVIGEDLGTVPPGFREELARWGIWTYQVMLFERGAKGVFHQPDHYSERALVTFATHDLPTFAGWVDQQDLQIRQALAMGPGETNEARTAAIGAVRRALRRHGLTGRDFPSIVHYLADSPAKLLAVALEDALGVQEQPNVPGMIDEYPNWRRKLPLDLEQLRDDPRLRTIARIAAERGRVATPVPRAK
jgi:4-alpha-glucanotransferase